MILAGTMLTFVPGLLVATIEAVVGGNSDRQPTTIFTTTFVVFLLNSVLNPTIQSYFWRDVYDFLTTKVLKTKSMCIPMVLV